MNSYQESDHPKLVCLKYEDLLTGEANVLTGEMSKLDGKEPNIERAQFFLDDLSFGRRSGRKPDTIDRNSFLRKGIAGDWKNHLTRESAQIFDHYCGTALIAAGYEQDRSWIGDLPTS